ncbi:hypothetical protein [Erythrobacter sp. SD-21]|uniref:hypothetical protein n=1 Tax=Erythrobacter sp. SD-21 TaxID=161528 RepID=UPI000153FC41|nr:hypothetical protein [Erythrobacter sp. SD-21]EDL48836.1 hypothetical protein ED21_23936 [Erythrobacter sp. SD-21]
MRETFPLRWAFIGVAAILLAFSGGGVVWWSQGEADRSESENTVQSCVSEMARRDPLAEARADLARGEDRPLLVYHNGEAPFFGADGIPECGFLPSPPHSRYAHFDLGPTTDEVAPCCDRDPMPNPCGKAQMDWTRAYNAELARLKPEIVGKYCTARKGNS